LKNFYWSPFSKWPPQYRKNSTLSELSTGILNSHGIGQCLIFTAHFLCRVLAAILKMADICENMP
jgi:hypothetical protein